MSTPRSAARDRSEHGTDRTAREVAAFLQRTPPQLPTRLLYDPLGSALFEAICRMPWYRIASTEQHLIEQHAPAVFARLGLVGTVVELGPGSGQKLAMLLSRRPLSPVNVHLVDVSAEALGQAERALSAMPEVWVETHHATYEAGLAQIDPVTFGRGRALVVFLGSNIGNYDPAEANALLRNIRGTVRAGDALLLGADLVKPEPELLLAYDDPLGVTAAFNRNLLVRVNRELGSDFDVTGFEHRATWSTDASRVEMHLVSLRRQTVTLPDRGFSMTFEAGDTIWTESSYKFRVEELASMLAAAGFRLFDQQIADGFALTLAAAE
jgi:L-histidine N-alpha-methyltransferase